MIDTFDQNFQIQSKINYKDFYVIQEISRHEIYFKS
jgi:hypothetical protein